MSGSKGKKGRAVKIPTQGALLLAWCDAAEDWRRLQRSDTAEARCRVARAAYYLATIGYVPSLKCVTAAP